MNAVVALGNVGSKYSDTRHNAGFHFADALASACGLEFKNSSKLHSLIAKGENIVVAKPTTMMNSSGIAAAKVIDFYSISYPNLYIVHDDLDIRLGEYKMQLGKGPKVHNGVSSIEVSLGTSEFWRIRIGIDNRNAEPRTRGEEYVLSRFSESEARLLQQVVKEAADFFVHELKLI